MRLTVGGTFVYAGTALLLFVQAVRLALLDTLWADGVAVAPVSLVVLTAGAALLFTAGALTRQPLIEADPALPAGGEVARTTLHRWVGPWFGAIGWAVVIALTAVGIAVALMASFDEVTGLWVTGPAVFVPFWVRKLEESYREGVDEARQGL